MITTPSVDQLLEGVMLAIEDEIVPSISNPKAHATAQMIQSVLQGVRQMLPVIDAQLAEEHNDMIRTLREAAESLGDAPGDAADRVRERAATFGGRDELPVPVDRDAALASYEELGHAIEASFRDLDELLRDGVESAAAAQDVVRAHLMPRYLRDVASIKVHEGFVGRS
ncbi:MAG: hypothetical protein AAF945_10530 [Actinomycetota bacterium]